MNRDLCKGGRFSVCLQAFFFFFFLDKLKTFYRCCCCSVSEEEHTFHGKRRYGKIICSAQHRPMFANRGTFFSCNKTLKCVCISLISVKISFFFLFVCLFVLFLCLFVCLFVFLPPQRAHMSQRAQALLHATLVARRYTRSLAYPQTPRITNCPKRESNG